jgi:phosphatidylglycerol:prolipoprotein diacylglycerol transferase
MLTISIDPVAFTIGSLAVRWYGIMVAVGVVSALAITLREAKRLGVPHDIYGLFLWGIIGGFIGGRLAHVIDYWEDYVANPRGLIGFAGLALYGTIIGVLVAVWIYMRVRRVPFSSLAGVGDAIALGAPVAQAIGRIGCTINGCCFGKPSPFTSFPGAVIYTARDTIPRYWHDLHLYQDGITIPLYPAQIYFLLWNLIVFAILWRFRGKLKPQGSLFFLYLCLYAAGDFALRFFRLNEPFLLGLHQGQVISLAILVVAVPWLIIRLRRFQKQALVTELANGAELEQSHED